MILVISMILVLFSRKKAMNYDNFDLDMEITFAERKMAIDEYNLSEILPDTLMFVVIVWEISMLNILFQHMLTSEMIKNGYLALQSTIEAHLIVILSVIWYASFVNRFSLFFGFIDVTEGIYYDLVKKKIVWFYYIENILKGYLRCEDFFLSRPLCL